MISRRTKPDGAESASDTDSDAPEAVSLSQSKKHSKIHEAAIQQAQAAQKEKTRLRNQKRDKKLKDQAAHSKKKLKEKDAEEDPQLHARMERALREAVDEAEGTESNDSDDDDETFPDFEAASSPVSGDEDDDDNGDEMDAEPTSTQPPSPAQPKRNPKHLPDYLFTSAFAAQAEKAKSLSKSSSKRKATDDEDLTQTSQKRKRARSTAVPKDVLIGSRAIRTLSQNSHPSGAGTLPSAKVKKFLNRTLALKGGKPRNRGWERKPVNIGVMKRDGPAASFVRKKLP